MLTYYPLSTSNNRSSANTVSIPNGSAGPAPIRIDATQAHQHHRPAAISRYIREVDQYNAWLGGQNQANPTRHEAKAQYVKSWDRNWGQLNTARSRRDQEGRDSAGDTNHVEGPYGGEGFLSVGTPGVGGSRHSAGGSHDGGSHQAGATLATRSYPNGAANSLGGSSHYGGGST